MAKVTVLKSFLNISFNPQVRSAYTLRCLKARHPAPICNPHWKCLKSSEKSYVAILPSVNSYSWSSSSTPDWNTGNVVEINTFGKDGLDLRRFDYGVAIGLSVEYRHYVIGVEGRLGLCKLQKELQGKNITGFVTAGYKF